VRADADILDLEHHRRVMDAMAPCSVTSFIGLPAVAVPAGLSRPEDSESRRAVPLGVQLVGGPFREDLCLEAAAVLERGFGGLRIPG
ncbi:MAG TPA: hypothetical protein VMC79_08570, partial [Rectinemataceae bacterium]|nr:hypothetical protein [Rectinemataceae bacterium]